MSAAVLKSNLPTREILHDLEQLFPLGPREKSTDVRTYRDTFDWRIHRSGLILFTSPAGTRVRMTLQDADGRTLEILVPKVPLFAGDLPPCPLKETLEPVVQQRRLFPQAEARWTNLLVPLSNHEDHAVLSLLFREGKAQLPDGTGESILETRVEVQSLAEGRSAVREITAYLRNTLRLTGEKRGEAHAAYDAVGMTPGSSSSLRLKLKPHQKAGAATRRILRELLRSMLANQEGVIRNWDSEFLHDFRVALRRTRSALRELEGVLPEGAVDHFSKEFRWLGVRTGAVRDLDVHLLRIPTFRAALDPSAGTDLEPLVQLLLEKKRKEQRRLRYCLRSKRYLRLMSEWSAFLEEPVTKGSAPPRSKAPIREVAFSAIRKAYGRTVKRGRKLGPGATPEELHRLRIDCKKLRYLLTFFRTLLPAEALGPFNKELKLLQDRLGDLHDLHVQEAALRTSGEELIDTQQGPPQTLLAMGQLLGRMQRAQAEEGAAFRQHILRFAQPTNQEKLEELLREVPIVEAGKG